MKFNTLFFDLDDTLYPPNSGMWQAIRARIDQYMHTQLGLSWDEIPALREHFYLHYGTTLRGLQANYPIDTEDYLAYVHGVPLDDYLSPQPKLRTLLKSLPVQKWIFTNADAQHAKRVLKLLSVEDLFDGIIDVRAMENVAKPQTQAFQRAMEIAGVSDSQHCVLLDDSVRNLDGAQAMNFFTVLVGGKEMQPGHRWVPELLELPRYVPELWR